MHVAVGTGEPLLNVTSQGSSFTGNSVLVGSKDTPHSADRFSTDDRQTESALLSMLRSKMSSAYSTS